MDADKVINDNYRELQVLMRKLGYEGKGLHEMLNAAEQKDWIDERLMRSCRAVASIRNKHIHEAILDEFSLEKFQRSADYAIPQLEALIEERDRRERASRVSAAAVDQPPSDEQKSTADVSSNQNQEAGAAKATGTESQAGNDNKNEAPMSWWDIARGGLAIAVLLVVGVVKAKEVIDDFR